LEEFWKDLWKFVSLAAAMVAALLVFELSLAYYVFHNNRFSKAWKNSSMAEDFFGQFFLLLLSILSMALGVLDKLRCFMFAQQPYFKEF
jgi:uncharacterized membrane protein YphA (DoxX/SURF4 family)